MLATQQRQNPYPVALHLDFLNEPVKIKGIGSLTVTRAGATATAWCFAEADNPGATLQNIVIPANIPRYYGKRWIASNSTWSDKYAEGTPIEGVVLRGLHVEGASTNLFLNSNAPVTQNITTTAQTYTLSAWGTGTITLSGTATGTLTCAGSLPDDRIELTVTATAGTLTITVPPTAEKVQLEAKTKATSYIPTAGTAVIRNADNINFPISSNVRNSKGTILIDCMPAFDIPNSATVDNGQHYLIDFGTANGAIRVISHLLGRTDGTTGVFSPAWIPMKNSIYKIGSRYGAVGQKNFLNGAAGSNGAFDASINLGSSIAIGRFGGNSAYWGGYIRKIVIYKTALSDSKIQQMTDPLGNFDFSKADNSQYLAALQQQ